MINEAHPHRRGLMIDLTGQRMHSRIQPTIPEFVKTSRFVRTAPSSHAELGWNRKLRCDELVPKRCGYCLFECEFILSFDRKARGS